jgi:hypothetical protein
MAGDVAAHICSCYSGLAAEQRNENIISPEDAYLVVADAAGRVLWQTHGVPTDQKYSELQSVIRKQVSKP